MGPRDHQRRHRRVFLSYRREDSSAHTGRLFDSLMLRFGLANLFMDIDTIAPGADWAAAIMNTIPKCDVVLIVIGQGWLTAADSGGERRLDRADDVVRAEIQAALESEAVVIPVLVGGAVMPAAAEIPESIRSLVDRHAFALSDLRWGADVALLMRFIDGTRADLSGPVIIDPRVPGPPRAWIASAEEPLIELHGATVMIGRSPENDLVVGNDSTVSRLHAELLQHTDHWSVRDCRSRNGTYLNGERIDEATLRSGDVIHVGACEMLFTADDDVSSTTSAEDSEPAEV